MRDSIRTTSLIKAWIRSSSLSSTLVFLITSPPDAVTAVPYNP